MPQPFDLQAELSALPSKPGVYRHFDAKGKLLYVGKAKSLRNRVRQYFQSKAKHSYRIQQLVEQIYRFEITVTDTEVEALLLEDTLVKKHQPPYNIQLRDDKRYPWLALSGDDFPRLYSTRKPRRDGRTKHFGPYTDTGSLYRLMRTLRKHFPLRQRRNPLHPDRPCMNYHIGLCPGPCQGLVSPEHYQQTLQQIELFLKGHTDELKQEITQLMEAASEALNFEQAAKLRDRLLAVEALQHKHKIITDDPSVNQDVIAYTDDGWLCVVQVLTIRKGRLIASKAFELSMVQGARAEEVYAAFLLRYYRDQDPASLPTELLLPHAVADADLLIDWLTSVRQGVGLRKQVSIVVPKKGQKADLIAMALQNAQQALEQAQLYEATRVKNDPVQALAELQKQLALPTLPSRMECYDISHFQGAHTVASMVVFIDGQPAKQEYRRFKIKIAEGKPDDFASMHEVITRRSHRREDWGEPDLLIIDGGKGQLSSACEALVETEWIGQPIISLAKRYEEVFLPSQSRPVLLDKSSPALFVLQQIRDEAHRFAITYHRQLRDKKTLENPLSKIKGLGPKRQQVLLGHYRTLDAIQTEGTPDRLVSLLNCSPLQAQDWLVAIQGL